VKDPKINQVKLICGRPFFEEEQRRNYVINKTGKSYARVMNKLKREGK
jgi:hypothetical protein